MKEDTAQERQPASAWQKEEASTAWCRLSVNGPSRQMPSTRANYVRIGYLEWKHARETLSRLAPPLVKFSRIFPAVSPWIISQLLLRDWL